MPVIPSSPRIRGLHPNDVPALMRIQQACYGLEFMEPATVFERRLQSPEHCSLAACVDGQLVAFLAAYWSTPGAVTPLHGDFQNDHPASLLYLHDMAVDPALAGQGLAGTLLKAAKALARQRGITLTALVSVQDSCAYWQRQGYQIHPITHGEQAANLNSYGPQAVYMLGEIGGPEAVFRAAPQR